MSTLPSDIGMEWHKSVGSVATLHTSHPDSDYEGSGRSEMSQLIT
jgi:hypothetical protein